MTQEIRYLLDRSSREAVRAIQAEEARSSGVHEELCLLYTARALARLAAEKRRARLTQPLSSAAR